MRAAPFAAGLAAFLAVTAAAQDKKKPADAGGPRLLYPIPLAVAPGYKGKVTLRGQRLADVTEVVAGDPKANVKLLSKPRAANVPMTLPKDKLGDAELDIELELPKDFPAGTLELTAAGPKGKSEPYRLAVDGGPRTAEKEPNDGFAAAQELTLPTTVDGTIGRDKDVDVFRFAGKAGQAVRVEVRAARLGSPADTMLTLYDEDRLIVASCDDADGSPDPVLAVTLPRDGVYFVSVIESGDAGGPTFGYRLAVTLGK